MQINGSHFSFFDVDVYLAYLKIVFQTAKIYTKPYMAYFCLIFDASLVFFSASVDYK